MSPLERARFQNASSANYLSRSRRNLVENTAVSSSQMNLMATVIMELSAFLCFDGTTLVT